MTIGRTYKMVIVASIFAYGALLVWRPLEPHDDVWAHATVGSWIWDRTAVPRETLFLWPDSISWVYHHWLSALVFYGIASLPFEHSAIMGFTVLVGLTPLALVVCVWKGRDSSWFAIPGVWMLNGIIDRIQPRPDLFTSLGITALLILLGRFPGSASPRWLAGFLLLFAVWANLHGAVVVGLLLLAATAACDAIQDRDWRRGRALGLLLVASITGTHLNPYGFGYWRALMAIRSFTFSNLVEWKPPWAEPRIPEETIAGAAVAAALASAAWSLSPRRRLAELAWLLLAAALFMQARRNVSVFILVCAVVTAFNSQSIEGRRLWSLLNRRKKGVPGPMPFRWLIRVGILCYLAGELAALAVRPSGAGALQHIQDGSVAFLQRHQVRGRVFNDMDNSAYFHWQFRADMPLFIDGMNAYSDQLMRDYFAITRGRAEAHALVDSYGVNVIILTVHRNGSLSTLATNLDRDPEWSRVYAARDAVIWVRRRDFAPLVEKVGPVSPVSFATLEMWR